ncbi:hypothetical protein Peur_061102 [Populus x canadensis]
MMLAKAFQLAEYQARASAQCVHATGTKVKVSEDFQHGINCSHLTFFPVHMKKTSSANLIRPPEPIAPLTGGGQWWSSLYKA